MSSTTTTQVNVVCNNFNFCFHLQIQKEQSTADCSFLISIGLHGMFSFMEGYQLLQSCVDIVVFLC